MPSRKYNKSKRKTKRKSSKRKTYVPRHPASPTKLAKLRYCETQVLNPGLGTPAVWVASMNSAYDPAYTGTGHQPFGFDQWTALYEKYKVVGAKLTVVFSNTGATIPTSNTMCGIHISDTGNYIVTKNVNHIRETGYTRWKYLTYAQSKVKMTEFWSSKKFFGKNRIENPEDLVGNTGNTGVGSDPATQAFGEIWCVGTDPARDGEAVVASIILEQLVMFSDLRELGQS